MAKYLLKASYTPDGTKGLLKEGGSCRKAVVQETVNGLGGKLEAFYYAFGEPDVYSIVEVPDATSIAALSLTVNALGAVRLSTTPLLTAEEVDAACKKSGHLADELARGERHLSLMAQRGAPTTRHIESGKQCDPGEEKRPVSRIASR